MRALFVTVIGTGLLIAGCKGTLSPGNGTNATVTGIWSRAVTGSSRF